MSRGIDEIARIHISELERCWKDEVRRTDKRLDDLHERIRRIELLKEVSMIDCKLKPCPFCGGESISLKLHRCENHLPYIECDACKIEVSYGDCIDSAIELWNARQP